MNRRGFVGALICAPVPAAIVAPAVAPPAAAVESTLVVEGINPHGVFSGADVKALVQRCLEFQREGGTVVVQG